LDKIYIQQRPLKGLGLSAGHSQVDTRNTFDPNITLPGYIIFNAGIHYRYQHFLLAMNVNNLTNKTYWTSAYNNVSKWPGAPRNFMINLGNRF
jgi:iron complex outermembrane receptor protein